MAITDWYALEAARKEADLENKKNIDEINKLQKANADAEEYKKSAEDALLLGDEELLRKKEFNDKLIALRQQFQREQLNQDFNNKTRQLANTIGQSINKYEHDLKWAKNINEFKSPSEFGEELTMNVNNKIADLNNQYLDSQKEANDKSKLAYAENALKTEFARGELAIGYMDPTAKQLKQQEKESIITQDAKEKYGDMSNDLFNQIYASTTNNISETDVEYITKMQSIPYGLAKGAIHFTNSSAGLLLSMAKTLSKSIKGDFGFHSSGDIQPANKILESLGFTTKHQYRADIFNDLFTIGSRLDFTAAIGKTAESIMEMGAIGLTQGLFVRGLNNIARNGIGGIAEGTFQQLRHGRALAATTGDKTLIKVFDDAIRDYGRVAKKELTKKEWTEFLAEKAAILNKLGKKDMQFADRLKKATSVKSEFGYVASQMGLPMGLLIGDIWRRANDINGGTREKLSIEDFQAAMVHTAVDYMAAWKLLGMGNRLVRNETKPRLLDAIKDNFKPETAIVGYGAGMAYEGFGEMIQTYLELQGANNYSLPDLGTIIKDPRYEKYKNQIIEAGAYGAIGGGIFGAIGAVQGLKKPPVLESPQRQEESNGAENEYNAQSGFSPDASSSQIVQSVNETIKEVLNNQDIQNEIKEKVNSNIHASEQEQNELNKIEKRLKRIFGIEEGGRLTEQQVRTDGLEQQQVKINAKIQQLESNGDTNSVEYQQAIQDKQELEQAIQDKNHYVYLKNKQQLMLNIIQRINTLHKAKDATSLEKASILVNQLDEITALKYDNKKSFAENNEHINDQLRTFLKQGFNSIEKEQFAEPYMDTLDKAIKEEENKKTSNKGIAVTGITNERRNKNKENLGISQEDGSTTPKSSETPTPEVADTQEQEATSTQEEQTSDIEETMNYQAVMDTAVKEYYSRSKGEQIDILIDEVPEIVLQNMIYSTMKPEEYANYSKQFIFTDISKYLPELGKENALNEAELYQNKKALEQDPNKETTQIFKRFISNRFDRYTYLPKQVYIDGKLVSIEDDAIINKINKARTLYPELNIKFSASERALQELADAIDSNADESEIKLKLKQAEEHFANSITEINKNINMYLWLSQNVSSPLLRKEILKLVNFIKSRYDEQISSIETMSHHLEQIDKGLSDKVKNLHELATTTSMSAIESSVNALFQPFFNKLGNILKKPNSRGIFTSFIKKLVNAVKSLSKVFDTQEYYEMRSKLDIIEHNINAMYMNSRYHIGYSRKVKGTDAYGNNIMFNIDSDRYRSSMKMMGNVLIDAGVSEFRLVNVMTELFTKLFTAPNAWERGNFAKLATFFTDANGDDFTITIPPILRRDGTVVKFDESGVKSSVSIKELLLFSTVQQDANGNLVNVNNIVEKLFSQEYLDAVNQNEKYKGWETDAEKYKNFIEDHIQPTIRNILKSEKNRLAAIYTQAYYNHAAFINSYILGLINRFTTLSEDRLVDSNGDTIPINITNINSEVFGFAKKFLGLTDDNKSINRDEADNLAVMSHLIAMRLFHNHLNVKGKLGVLSASIKEDESSGHYIINISRKQAEELRETYGKAFDDLNSLIDGNDFLEGIISDPNEIKDFVKRIESKAKREGRQLKPEEKEVIKMSQRKINFKEAESKQAIKESFGLSDKQYEEFKKRLENGEYLESKDFYDKIRKPFIENENGFRDKILANKDKLVGRDNPLNYLPIKMWDRKSLSHKIRFIYMPPETGINWSNYLYRKNLDIDETKMYIAEEELSNLLDKYTAKMNDFSFAIFLHMSKPNDINYRYNSGNIDLHHGFYLTREVQPSNRISTKNTSLSFITNKTMRSFYKTSEIVEDETLTNISKEKKIGEYLIKNNPKYLGNLLFSFGTIFGLNKIKPDMNTLKAVLYTETTDKFGNKRLALKKDSDIEQAIKDNFFNMLQTDIEFKKFEFSNPDGSPKKVKETLNRDLLAHELEKRTGKNLTEIYRLLDKFSNKENINLYRLFYEILNGDNAVADTAFMYLTQINRQNILDEEGANSLSLQMGVRKFIESRRKADNLYGIKQLITDSYTFVDGSATAMMENSLHMNAELPYHQLLMSAIDPTLKNSTLYKALQEQEEAGKLFQDRIGGDFGGKFDPHMLLALKLETLGLVFGSDANPLSFFNRFFRRANLMDRNGAKTINTPVSYASMIRKAFNASVENADGTKDWSKFYDTIGIAFLGNLTYFLKTQAEPEMIKLINKLKAEGRNNEYIYIKTERKLNELLDKAINNSDNSLVLRESLVYFKDYFLSKEGLFIDKYSKFISNDFIGLISDIVNNEDGKQQQLNIGNNKEGFYKKINDMLIKDANNYADMLDNVNSTKSLAGLIYLNTLNNNERIRFLDIQNKDKEGPIYNAIKLLEHGIFTEHIISHIQKIAKQNPGFKRVGDIFNKDGEYQKQIINSIIDSLNGKFDFNALEVRTALNELFNIMKIALIDDSIAIDKINDDNTLFITTMFRNPASNQLFSSDAGTQIANELGKNCMRIAQSLYEDNFKQLVNVEAEKILKNAGKDGQRALSFMQEQGIDYITFATKYQKSYESLIVTKTGLYSEELQNMPSRLLERSMKNLLDNRVALLDKSLSDKEININPTIKAHEKRLTTLSKNLKKSNKELLELIKQRTPHLFGDIRTKNPTQTSTSLKQILILARVAPLINHTIEATVVNGIAMNDDFILGTVFDEILSRVDHILDASEGWNSGFMKSQYAFVNQSGFLFKMLDAMEQSLYDASSDSVTLKDRIENSKKTIKTAEALAYYYDSVIKNRLITGKPSVTLPINISENVFSLDGLRLNLRVNDEKLKKIEDQIFKIEEDLEYYEDELKNETNEDNKKELQNNIKEYKKELSRLKRERKKIEESLPQRQEEMWHIATAEIINKALDNASNLSSAGGVKLLNQPQSLMFRAEPYPNIVKEIMYPGYKELVNNNQWGDRTKSINIRRAKELYAKYNSLSGKFDYKDNTTANYGISKDEVYHVADKLKEPHNIARKEKLITRIVDTAKINGKSSGNSYIDKIASLFNALNRRMGNILSANDIHIITSNTNLVDISNNKYNFMNISIDIGELKDHHYFTQLPDAVQRDLINKIGTNNKTTIGNIANTIYSYQVKTSAFKQLIAPGNKFRIKLKNNEYNFEYEIEGKDTLSFNEIESIRKRIDLVIDKIKKVDSYQQLLDSGIVVDTIEGEDIIAKTTQGLGSEISDIVSEIIDSGLIPQQSIDSLSRYFTNHGALIKQTTGENPTFTIAQVADTINDLGATVINDTDFGGTNKIMAIIGKNKINNIIYKHFVDNNVLNEIERRAEFEKENRKQEIKNSSDLDETPNIPINPINNSPLTNNPKPNGNVKNNTTQSLSQNTPSNNNIASSGNISSESGSTNGFGMSVNEVEKSFDEFVADLNNDMNDIIKNVAYGEYLTPFFAMTKGLTGKLKHGFKYVYSRDNISSYRHDTATLSIGTNRTKFSRLHEFFHAVTAHALKSNNPKVHIIINQMDMIREYTYNALKDNNKLKVQIFGEHAALLGITPQQMFDNYFRNPSLNHARSEFIAIVASNPRLAEWLSNKKLDKDILRKARRDTELLTSTPLGKILTYGRYLVSLVSSLFFESFTNDANMRDHMAHLIEELANYNNLEKTESKVSSLEKSIIKGFNKITRNVFTNAENYMNALGMDEYAKKQYKENALKRLQKDIIEIENNARNTLEKTINTDSLIAKTMYSVTGLIRQYINKAMLNPVERELYLNALREAKEIIFDGTALDMSEFKLNFSDYKNKNKWVNEIKLYIDKIHGTNQIYSIELEQDYQQTKNMVNKIIEQYPTLMEKLGDNQENITNFKRYLSAAVFNVKVGDTGIKINKTDIRRNARRLINNAFADNEQLREDFENRPKIIAEHFRNIGLKDMTFKEEEFIANTIKVMTQQLAITRLSRLDSKYGIQNAEEIGRYALEGIAQMRGVDKINLELDSEIISALHDLTTSNAIYLANSGQYGQLMYTQDKIKQLREFVKDDNQAKDELISLIAELSELQHTYETYSSHSRRLNYEQAKYIEKQIEKEGSNANIYDDMYRDKVFTTYDKFQYGKHGAWYKDNHIDYAYNNDNILKFIRKQNLSKDDIQFVKDIMESDGYKLIKENDDTLIFHFDATFVNPNNPTKIFGHKRYKDKASGKVSGQYIKSGNFDIEVMDEIDIKVIDNTELIRENLLEDIAAMTNEYSSDFKNAYIAKEGFERNEHFKPLAGSRHLSRHNMNLEEYETLTKVDTQIDELFGNTSAQQYKNNHIARNNSLVWDTVIAQQDNILKRKSSSKNTFHHSKPIAHIVPRIYSKKETFDDDIDMQLIVEFDKEFMKENEINFTDQDKYDLMKILQLSGRQYKQGDTIYIDTRFISQLFGYKIKDLSTITDKTPARNMLRSIGAWWRKGVKETKSTEVIRNSKLVVKNYISNLTGLFALGVPIKDIFNGMYVYHNELDRLQDLMKKRIKLKTQQRMLQVRKNHNSSIQQKLKKIETELSGVEVAINNNRMTPLIREGLYTNIIEEVDTKNNDLYSDIAKFLNKKEILSDKLYNMDGKLKTIMDEVSYGNKSTLYNFQARWTRYGDIVPRAILYYNRINNGDTHQEAINEARNVYISYASPLYGKTMRNLDHYGMVYYSKYITNVLPVVWNTLKTNPAKTATVMAIQTMLNMSYFTSYLMDNIAVEALTGNLRNPVLNFSHISSLNRWKNLPFL